ncbi:DNA topoisomerase-1 [Microbacteriaceae bacterium SG_E_30_P1]|uniref:DNA topoisomerase n=1 Tax=Antiquaquibacter oligotrophicus TaxID=2880260 RepID=A0ABT6KRI7_9MICO|nr:DNA topoisomerase IB [Antiquaquibacter oligotrophicus]MDH6182594.1 DNA topoisomerase-1 [Antiquaquibacter oligotrophicus]UDF14441.1 DNA topoisomerase IB [Antiquaquibacter oligotrophicus]
MRLTQARPYEAPGVTRIRRGDAFDYRRPDRRKVGAEERARFDALAIPPAWREVWIAPSPSSHILAVGLDDAGRRQYIYHPAWRAAQDEAKFDRALALAAALPAARRRAARSFGEPALSRDRVLATAFRILDLTAMRVGNETYATTNGSRGLCTLLVRHVVVGDGGVTFDFVGKSRQRASIAVTDAPLLLALDELTTHRAAGSRLLAWANGRRRDPIRTSEVNEFIRGTAGDGFTAKDFRTLHATATAAAALPRRTPEAEREVQRAIREATDAAARMLGNTPTVARASYIHPAVFERFIDGRTIARPGSMTSLLELLQD